jgi:3-deoxy-D-manno-octulosonate 8-phosphate phosphatase (KDO 8-P phosphatase)
MNHSPDFSNIALLAFDYDGVFTDGTILLMPDGGQLRQAFVRDGYAVQWAAKQEIQISIITGGREKAILKRMESLGVTDVHIGSSDKVAVMRSIIDQRGLSMDQVAYMGDDMPDLPLLSQVGLSACPSDAAPEILAACSFISSKPGGKGCVRELIEMMMKQRNVWTAPGQEMW